MIDLIVGHQLLHQIHDLITHQAGLLLLRLEPATHTRGSRGRLAFLLLAVVVAVRCGAAVGFKHVAVVCDWDRVSVRKSVL